MNKQSNDNYPEVSIQKCTYETLDILSLLQPLGGMNTFFEKGDRVLVKTNLLNATDPEQAVVTNPAFIIKIIESIIQAGGMPYIGDSPSGNFSKRRLQKVYEKTGISTLSKELGVELNYDTGYKKIPIPHGKKLTKTRISNFIVDADAIIALPKLKTHSLTMMTLATKIMFGAVPGLTKARYHSRYIKRNDFANMLLDILSITPPQLFIMDGIIGMQGDGPMSGTPVELNMALASIDPIAMDLAICKALKIEPMGIPTLKQANIRKLWPKKIRYPLLSPEDVEYNDFLLPSTAGFLLTGKKEPSKYPVVTADCVACGDCVQICPKKAISLPAEQAIIDYSKCIKCYCCHEVCTYNAISLDRINPSIKKL